MVAATEHRLKADPAWEAAGQQLVTALTDQPDDDQRVRLLERVWARFGEGQYPVFIQLLCAIEQFGDTRARAVVAQTLASALASARLPAGRLPAWGAARWSPAASPDAMTALLLPGLAAAPAPAAMARRAGPIEFLCAWLLQPGDKPTLARADFEFALQRLIELFNASASARRLYTELMLSEASDPLEGGFSRQTRGLIETIARQWSAADTPRQVVSQALSSVAGPARFGAPDWAPR
jgi:hypothetical protein